MTGFYTVALSAVYGISVYCLSEYSDAAFLDIIIDNKPYTAALYPWQVGERRTYIKLKIFLSFLPSSRDFIGSQPPCE